MVGTPLSRLALPPLPGNSVRAVTRPVAAELVFVFLGRMFGPQGQGSLEEVVVAVVG